MLALEMTLDVFCCSGGPFQAGSPCTKLVLARI